MTRCSKVLSLLMLTAAAPAMAQEGPIRGGTEKFKLSVGTILNQNDTTLNIKGPNGRGAEFGLEGLGGLQKDRWSTLASGTWRFSPNHRAGFQSFSTHSSGSRVIDREVTIKDEVIPIGTQLDTSAKTSFLIANYQYSLIRDDRIELSAMAGIYGAKFSYQFDATNPPKAINAKTTAPLPMFGISLDTFITPRWTISTSFEGLKLKVGDVGGKVVYLSMTTDYMITRHLGLGVGISAVNIGADVTKSDMSGSFDWRSQSFFAYGQVRF